MKTCQLLWVAAALTATGSAFGQSVQTNQPTATLTQSNVVATSISPGSSDLVSAPTATNGVRRVRLPGDRYTGVAPMIRRTKNPFQLINPFAPASYGGIPGGETDNLVAGQPGGIAILRIEF